MAKAKTYAARQREEMARTRAVRAGATFGLNDDYTDAKQEAYSYQRAYDRALEEEIARRVAAAEQLQRVEYQKSYDEGMNLPSAPEGERYLAQQRAQQQAEWQRNYLAQKEMDSLTGVSNYDAAPEGEAFLHRKRAEDYAASSPRYQYENTYDVKPEKPVGIKGRKSNTQKGNHAYTPGNRPDRETMYDMQQREEAWRNDRDALIDRFTADMEAVSDVSRRSNMPGYQKNQADMDTLKRWQETLLEVERRGGIEALTRLEEHDKNRDYKYRAMRNGVDIEGMTLPQKVEYVIGDMFASAGLQSGAAGVGVYQGMTNKAAEMAEDGYDEGLKMVVNHYLGALANDPNGEGTQSMRESIATTARTLGGDDYANRILAYIDNHVQQVRANTDRPDFSDYYVGLDLSSVGRYADTAWRNLHQIAGSQDVYDTMFRLQDKANEYMQHGKDIMQSKTGDRIMEAGVSAIQSAADALPAAALGLTGPLAMAPFGVRAYGGSVAEASRAVMSRGETIGKEMARNINRSAGISAAIEVGTEMLWGLVGARADIMGGGALDDAVTKRLTSALERMSTTERGSKILSYLGEKVLGGVFEGVEEVLADAANWLLDTAGMYGEDRGTFEEMFKEAGTSFTTGVLSGWMGEVSRVATKPMGNSMAGRGIRQEVGELSSMLEAARASDSRLGETLADIASKRGIDLGAEITSEQLSEQLTNADIGKLYSVYEETLDNEGVEDIRRALQRMENGKELTERDVNRIARNEEALQYLEDVTGEEIDREDVRQSVITALNELASQNEAIESLKDMIARQKEEMESEAKERSTENIPLSLEGVRAKNMEQMDENIRKTLGAENDKRTTDEIFREREAAAHEAAGTFKDFHSEREGIFEQQARKHLIGVNEALERIGIENNDVRAELMAAYNPGQNAVEYAGEGMRFYTQGKNGEAFDYGKAGENPAMSLAQARVAYNAGRYDAKYGTKAGENIRVHEGGERNDGEGAVGSAERLVENAGGNQVGQAGQHRTTAGTSQVRNGVEVGAKISTIGLSADGIRTKMAESGSGYQLVDDVNDKDYAAAKKVADEYGVELVAWRGKAASVDGKRANGFVNLKYDGNGKVVGGTIFVQLDSVTGDTAEMIAEHEAAHIRIAKGEIVLGEVHASADRSGFATARDYLIEKTGEEAFLAALDSYADAHARSLDDNGRSVKDENGHYTEAFLQEIFEEMICDAAGNMNANISIGHYDVAHKHSPVMEAAKEYTDQAAGNETRGSPYGNTEGTRRIQQGVKASAVLNAPVSQQINSAGTSLNQVPALHKDSRVEWGDTNIDIGAGAYEAATEYLKEKGVRNLKWDPYNQSEDVNRSTLKYLQDGNKADTATSANVLNVIREKEARLNVILQAAKSIKEDGKAYFMVYEGDQSGVGRETSKGWQNNLKTKEYADEIGIYFNNVQVKGKLIVASEPKANLPQASWEVKPGSAIKFSQVLDANYDKPITKQDVSLLQSIGRKSINDFTQADIQKSAKWAYKFYKEMGVKSPFFRRWFGDWRSMDKAPYKVTNLADGNATRNGRATNRDTGKVISWGERARKETAVHQKRSGGIAIDALGAINDIIENAVLLDTSVSLSTSSTKMSNTAFMHNFYAIVNDNGDLSLLKLFVEEALDNRETEVFTRAYELKDIALVVSGVHSDGGLTTATSADVDSVSDLYRIVKKYDKSFSPAHEVSPELLNEDGTPKILWHQTAADIEEFSNENPVAGKTDSETPNGFFAKENNHDIGLEGKKQMPIFMTMQNPLRFSNRKEANAWYCKNVDGYKSLQDEMESKIKTIDQEMGWIEDEMFDENTDDEQYEKLDADWNKKHDEMKNLENDYRGRLRGLLDDYFLNQDSGYDGIILDYDGHRYVDGKRENVKTYIAFKNTQIKSASDNIGTFDQSARVKTSTAFSRESDLVAANRQLKDDLSHWMTLARNRAEQRDRWRRETQVTKGRQVRMDDAKRLAKTLLKEHSSKADADALAKKVKDLSEFCLNFKEFDDAFLEEARMKSYEIAHMILEETEILNEQGGETFYKDLRDYLRKTKMFVPVGVQHDLTPDKWNDYRKSLMGTLNLSAADTKAMGIDVAYKELQDKFGEWLFPDDIVNPADQVRQMLEVVETYKPVYEHINDYDMAEAVEWAANDILTRVVGEELRQTEPTYADRMEGKLKEQKEKAKADLAARYEAEKRLEQYKARSQKALKKVRQNRDEKVAQLKQHYQEVAEKRKGDKELRELRQRLLKLGRRVNSMKVPRVAGVLRDQIIGELDFVATSITGRKLANLQALSGWYNEQKRDDPNFFQDKQIEKDLERLGKKHIKDLSREEISDLIRVLQNFENEWSLKKDGKFIDSSVITDRFVSSLYATNDILATKGRRSKNETARWLSNFFIDNQLSSDRAIKRLTGYRDNDPLRVLMKEVEKGHTKKIDFTIKANKMFAEWLDDDDFAKQISGKKARPIKVVGTPGAGKMTKTIEITPGHAIGLYLSSMNDDNMRHIMQGGIRVPDISIYRKGNVKLAYEKGELLKFTKEAIREVEAQLTDKEKAFANKVYEYFNRVAPEAINAVSEQLLGYSKATVKKYYPIKVLQSFLRRDFGDIAEGGTPQSLGFLNERVDSAKNPVVLADVVDVLRQSIDQNGTYVGLAIPIRNFELLYNTNAKAEDGMLVSVKEALGSQWGHYATDYIDKVIMDVQGKKQKAKEIEKPLNKARGNQAKAALYINAGTGIKQAASGPIAAATLGAKAVRKAFMNPASLARKVDPKLISRYTPLYEYRALGYSTPELGDITNKKADLPKALKWIESIDLWTVRRIWRAAEYYVLENNKDLKPYSHEFYEAVKDKWEQTVHETQPNYTPMQRAQSLRSEGIERTFHLFKTQPYQNFNIVYDAVGEFRAKRQQMLENTTEDTVSRYKETKVGLARAIGSQMVSSFVFALMQYVVDMARGKRKKYEDDDGERTFLSWLKGMGLNMLSNGAGMLPLGGLMLEGIEYGTDLVLKSLGKEAFFEQRYWGISEPLIDAINDSGSFVGELLSKLAAFGSGKKSTETFIREMVDLSGELFNLAGIPVSNSLRTMQSLARVVMEGGAATGLLFDGNKLEAEFYSLRMTTDPAKYPGDYYNLLYKAYRNDPAAYERIRQQMLEDGAKKKNNNGEMVPVFTEDSITDKLRDFEKKRLDKNEAYQSQYKAITSSDLWNMASEAQKSSLAESLFQLTMQEAGLGNSKGEKPEAEIAAGKAVGIDTTEYMLFQLALKMTNEDGGNPKNDEITAAVEMVPGLNDSERAFLWGLKNSTPTNNPWKESLVDTPAATATQTPAAAPVQSPATAPAKTIQSPVAEEKPAENSITDSPLWGDAQAVGLDESKYSQFLAYYEAADANKSGTINNRELHDAVDRMGKLTDDQKAFFWKNYAKGIDQGKVDSVVSGGKRYGLTETEYMLYKMALTMSSPDTSYSQAETEAAIRMLTGLSDAERAYLFEAQHPTAKKNPWK